MKKFYRTHRKIILFVLSAFIALYIISLFPEDYFGTMPIEALYDPQVTWDN